jgi:hypothetical protein
VPEQLLDRADVVAGLQQMRGEAVPHGIHVVPMNRLWQRSAIATIRFTAKK